MRLLANLKIDSAQAAPRRTAGGRGGRTTLTAALFESLRSFIYERTGIYFQDNKRYLLESRIGRRMEELGLPDYEAYLKLLQQPAAIRQEIPLLYNAITINETYFFRNPAQFDIIANEILPERARTRMERGGSRRLRIWSAACSSGDEPYTLALIALEQLLPKFPGLSVEIIGTDLNTEVLDTGRKGIYGDYAVRNIPPAYLKRYFKEHEGQYGIDERVKRMVRFKQVNLMDRGAMSLMRDVDLILCANVLIYFDQESKQQVVTSLYNSLADDAYLIVGFSETLYGVTQAFRPVRFNKTIAYQKGGRHA